MSHSVGAEKTMGEDVTRVLPESQNNLEGPRVARRGRESRESGSSSVPSSIRGGGAPVFSQRIVHIDHYTTFPTVEFDGAAGREEWVPIIRIFGSTTKGQKTCSHVHGVYPYLTVLYDWDVKDFERSIEQDLDKALNEFQQNTMRNILNKKDVKIVKRKQVYKTVKVKGRTYYGYRHGEEMFLRIYFYNPFMIKKAADVLMSGSILCKKIQPYDAHIPYHLQFLIDFNLYGMNLVHFSAVKFRRSGALNRDSPVSSRRNSCSLSEAVWDLTRLSEAFFSNSLENVTTCELEIDVLASDILSNIGRSNVRSSNPGIDMIWQDEMERRRQIEGIDGVSQLSIPESQDRPENEIYSTEALYKKILQEKLSKNYCSISAETTFSLENDYSNTIPASQTVNHFNTNSSISHSSLENEVLERSNMDENYHQILEHLMRQNDEKSIESDHCDTNSFFDNDFQQEIDVEEEFDESDEHKLHEEDQWKKSFLSNTILEEILAEDTIQTRRESQSTESTDINVSPTLSGQKLTTTKTIPQVDGLDDSSDSETDGTLKSFTAKPKTKDRSLLSKTGSVSLLTAKVIANCISENGKERLKLPKKFDDVFRRVPIVSLERLAFKEIKTGSASTINFHNIASLQDEQPRDQSFDTAETLANLPCNCAKSSVSPNVFSDTTIKTKSWSIKSGMSRSPTVQIEFHSSTNQKEEPRYSKFLKKILRKNSKNGQFLSPVKLDQATSPVLTSPIFQRDGFVNSVFQLRRSISKSNSRRRRIILNAKKLQANYNAPDIFREEFEPLKQPQTYRSFMKRLQEKIGRGEEEDLIVDKPSIKRPGVAGQRHANNSLHLHEVNFSSQENTPKKVLQYNVGSSDEDGASNNCSNSFASSPANSLCWTPDMSHLKITPKSILKNSQTHSSRKLKLNQRKITWDSGSPHVQNVDLSNERKEIGEGESGTKSKNSNISELDGPTLRNVFDFDMSNLHDAKALHQHQYLTIMSLELHCESRDAFVPNPSSDRIAAIFVYISNDFPEFYSKEKSLIRCFLTTRVIMSVDSNDPTCEYYLTEHDLLQGFLKFFHSWDPDILVGYEIEKFSWGYLIDRGEVIGLDMVSLLSRLKPTEKKRTNSINDSAWNGRICGRIVLNLWRLLRHEITVQSYTYENAAYHILHKRVFRLNFETLNEFWNHASDRWRVLEYYAERAKGCIEMMQKLDMVNRTSELSRLFGILFYEVFSRGSQFRVESMMLRVTKAQNLIPVSPSIRQRAAMKAPEYLPLILEPISNYYKDPVAVLDFQSLYPSMIIAYNYDYATVIGRVENLGTDEQFELGCTCNSISPVLLKEISDSIHISPAGVAFVKSSVRKGVLSEMLEQILETRQMVKRSMKKWKKEGATIQKVLDSRQLGLKLIANVTYGYTSANFSGRMPCIEIADSVVSKGRETLQRAIDFVKANYDRFGGEVLYGDTDSLFVIFRGKSKADAFRLGKSIAEEVTQLNPKPVKLKFEKIYYPCILQTKKRYVGYSYETEDQMEPCYDAKGIETVRRDGCPAVKKILEKCLHILFTTNDEEKVKHYVQLQFKKLFTGRVSMQDFVFAREFRGAKNYRPGACVPSLEIAKKIAEVDPRAEPLPKQRVPYVVIYDKPTLPLIQLVRTPLEFASDCSLRLNSHYYIEKAIIPALNRCLILSKMDATKWYKCLPRKYLRNVLDENLEEGSLDDFIHHSNCVRCDLKTVGGICSICDDDEKKQQMTSYLMQVSQNMSTKLETACKICSGDDDKCDNTDCPVFHKLLRYERDENYNRYLISKLNAIQM